MFKPGDRVTYKTESKSENGVVKSVSDENHVFVVYHCDDGWDRCEEHAAVRTRISDLVMGWESTMAKVQNLTASFPCLNQDGEARLHDDGKSVMMNKVSVSHRKNIKSYLLKFTTYEGRALTTTKFYISEKGAAALAMLLSHESFRDNLIEGMKTLQEKIG
jgi:hypothetical protein